MSELMTNHPRFGYVKKWVTIFKFCDRDDRTFSSVYRFANGTTVIRI